MGPRALIGVICAVNLATGCLVGIALDRTLLAHGSHGGRGPGGPGFDRMARQLDLDAQQQEKVRAILAARQPQFQKLFSEMRPRMEALREETEVEVKALLRPEQITKLDELHKDDVRLFGPQGGPPPGKRGE